MFSAGTRTSSNSTSPWPCGASSKPKTGSMRFTVTPGQGSGTRIMDCCLWRSGLSGSLLPMTIRMRQRGSSAPEVHHLRPLTTYASPSRSIRVSMLVASEEATSTSVIAKAERISPASSGLSHSFRCASVP